MYGLLSREAMLEAAHDVYTVFYQRAEEEAGLPASDWQVVSRLPDAVQLPIIAYYLGRAHQAWGYDPGLVLHHMGIASDDVAGQALAVYRLLMGGLGHGVSLADEHAGRLDRASDVLLRSGGSRFDPVPFEFEGREWDELAREAVGARCTASSREPDMISGRNGPGRGRPARMTNEEEGPCRSGATTIPPRATPTTSCSWSA